MTIGSVHNSVYLQRMAWTDGPSSSDLQVARLSTGRKIKIINSPAPQKALEFSLRFKLESAEGATSDNRPLTTIEGQTLNQV